MNNHFKIIIPTYNNEKWIRACIKSVKNQDYSDYQCIVVDDLSNDNSVDLIKKETEGCHKFVFIENTEKKYALRNIYEAIELSEPNREDIIVTLDGDDFFFKNKVLSTLNEAYNEKQCWITYGSYAEYPSNTRGKFSQKIPDEIIDANSFRESIWMSSHLRTFKYKLWQEIKKEDLLNPDGSFCDGAWDMAFMFPMLEMAGSNSHYIEDILYIYNRINPLNEDKVNHRKILESESRIRKNEQIWENRYMISAHLQGGLGNQLFQIAAATALARRNKDVALFNLKYHDLPMQGRKAHCYLDNILRNVYFTKNFKPSHYYHENSFCYTPIEYRKGITIKGYFQSEKYFSDQKDLIRKMFSVDDTTKQQILEKYGTTLARQPVSLHVRRGDYLTEPDFMITQTRKYYNKAIETFSPDTTYLVFSDDIEWSKEQFPEENFLFAENNEDYVDLYLMSMCAHNIMTNSSFSWWAAWLNENKEKRVIAPSQWFAKQVNYNTSDLIPERWEKL